MTTWARKVNNQAVDVVTVDPATLFYQTLATQFIVVPDGTLTGATFDGAAWHNPSAAGAPSVIHYAPLTPMQFYMAFSPSERIKLKLLASAGGVPANNPFFGGANAAIPQDALVAELWSTYELTASQAGATIDPNMVQGSLAYIAGEAIPGLPTLATPIITADRIAAISAGTPAAQ